MLEELKRRGISAARMARDVGISPSYLSVVLHDRAPYPPAPETMARIQGWFKTCCTCHRPWPEEGRK